MSLTNTTRYNTRLEFSDVIPKRRDGFCRCGCGRRARRQWATDQCPKPLVQAFKVLKGDAGTIRDLVKARDKGVCAGCKCDTQAMRRRATVDRAYASHLWIQGFRSHMWEADHILEVVNGGGAVGTIEEAREAVKRGVDLSNFQTLCTLCHNLKTAQLSKARAMARRASAREARRLPTGSGHRCPDPVRPQGLPSGRDCAKA